MKCYKCTNRRWPFEIKQLEEKVALLERNTKAVSSEETTILSADSPVPNEVNNEQDTSSDTSFSVTVLW